MLDARAQPLGEVEDDILLHLPGWRDRAGVDAAMARIEHHQRTRVGALLVLACGCGLRRPLRRQQPILDRNFVQEALPIGGNQVEHEPRRVAGRRIHDEGLVDAHRLGHVEHDARTALHHQPETKRLDQPAAVLPRLRRQLEGHLGDVDDDPVGIGEREGVQVDLAGQIHDEAGIRLVAAQPDIGRRRE